MMKNKGIGLAASQIDRTEKVFIIHPKLAERYQVPLVYQNPTITGMSDYRVSEKEGCLSFPGKEIDMSRAYRVNLKSDEGEFIARDILARVFQHEVDHLNGKTII